jgi:outer membrane protein OmpA-like peptidoglycan-associated protein
MRNTLTTPWSNIADLMAGLMMVFLFVSVSYAFQVSKQKEKLEEKNRKITEIAERYTDDKDVIYRALSSRFNDNLEEWQASIDKDTLTFRFSDPALLFEPGSSKLTPRFEKILTEFWPAYVEILEKYSQVIREVKIEGHTSSEWADATLDEAYFNNMQLSQERTRATLLYCYGTLPAVKKKLVRSLVAVNGMSFSRPILNAKGEEEPELSRRVEFTIEVDSTTSLNEIIGEIK